MIQSAFVCFVMGLCAITTTAVHAEVISGDFVPFVYDTETPDVLRLEGEINGRTPITLRWAGRQYPQIKTLALTGPGGSAYDALNMAYAIREAGLKTNIPSGARCFSACALMFFAGVERSAEGELGVHQLTVGNSASAQFAAGDLVKILTEFGVPTELIVRLLQTATNQMYVLYAPEMQRLGLLGTVESVPPLASPLPAAEPELSDKAIAFIERFMSDWSLPNSEALPRMPQYLGSELFYFGSQLSRAKVMVETEKLAWSWPERNYRLVPGSAEVACIQTRCTMTAQIAWTTHAPDRGKSAGGISENEFILEWNGYTFHIVYEDGKVVARDGVDDVYVQLAALGTQGAAAQMLARLSAHFRPALGESEPFIRRVESGDTGVPYRILVRASILKEAYALCTRIKDAGGDCFVRMD